MSQTERAQTVTFQTSRFGEVEAPLDQMLALPNGMICFPHLPRYLLIKHREGSPFHWLQAVENPELAFVVMTPCSSSPTTRSP